MIKDPFGRRCGGLLPPSALAGVACWLIFFGAVVSMAPAQAAIMVLHRGNQSEPDTLDPNQGSTTIENNILGDMFLGLTPTTSSPMSSNAIVLLDFSTSKELVASYIKGFADNVEDIHRTRWTWLER